jgi:hypothetical protein
VSKSGAIYLSGIGGDVVVFQAGARLQERDTYEPVLDKIARTFEFID